MVFVFLFLELTGFYGQISSNSFEIIESENVLVSGLIYADTDNNLISPEPSTCFEINIEYDWISDNEIYRMFSENNINFSNPYFTIQKILVQDKGIVFYKLYLT